MANKLLMPFVVGLLLGGAVLLSGCAASDPSDHMSGSSVRSRAVFNPTPSPSEIRGTVP